MKIDFTRKNYNKKSLALSEFVHLSSSLPDPSKELFKELEERFYNFCGIKDRIEFVEK